MSRFVVSYIYITIVLFLPKIGKSTGIEFKLISDTSKIISLQDIATLEEDNFQFLDQLLENKQIIFLGEQTHFDGKTFELKVKLLDYLHKKHGFNVLAFESDFFGLYYANRLAQGDTDSKTVLSNSIFPMWSEAKELEPLFSLINNTSIELAGFDSQIFSKYTSDFLIEELKNYLKQHNIDDLTNDDYETLEEYLFRIVEDDLNLEEAERLEINSVVNKIISLVGNLQMQSQDEKEHLFWLQVFDNFQFTIEYESSLKKGVQYLVQSPRDIQMAKNLQFFLEQNPNHKLICWGASYHFAKDLTSIKDSELTQEYLAAMKKEMPEEYYDVDLEEISSATTMVKYLTDVIGKDKIYTVGFTSYEGHYGYPTDGKSEGYTILTPPEESIESYFLGHLTTNNGFLSLKNASATLPTYCSALGYLPISANWPQVFDGIFFIKQMNIPTYSDTNRLNEQSTSSLSGTNSTSTISGILINRDLKQPVPYAHILTNTNPRSGNTISNATGAFSLRINNTSGTYSAKDSIEISALGYKSFRRSLKDLVKNSSFPITIQLEPQDIKLTEVVVKAEKIEALDIIRTAIERVEQNYWNVPHNANFFYRNKVSNDENKYYANEAFFLLYDPKGYLKTSRDQVVKDRFVKITQARSINKDNLEGNVNWESIWAWTIWSHDPILTPNSPLTESKLKYYNFQLEGTKIIGDNKTFHITFQCLKPNAFTTGTSNLESYTGNIYVNTVDYAVLKYEGTATQKPVTFSSKKAYRRFDEPYISRNNYTDSYHYRKIENRYYVYYASQTNHEDILKIDNKTKIKAYDYLEELMVLDLHQKNLEVLDKNLFKINGKVEYDPKFWETSNLILDNDHIK